MSQLPKGLPTSQVENTRVLTVREQREVHIFTWQMPRFVRIITHIPRPSHTNPQLAANA